MIAVALLGFLGVDLVIAAKLLGILCALLTLLVLGLISQRILFDALPAAIAWLLLVASDVFVVWSVAGLETLGFTLLLVASIYLIAKEEKNGTIGGSSLALAGVALIRPEGIGLVGTLTCLRVMIRWLQDKQSLALPKYLLGLSLPFVVFAGHLVFNLAYYGYPLPTTIFAKTGDLIGQIKLGYGYLYGFWRDHQVFQIFAIALLPLLFFEPASRLINILMIGTICAYALFILVAGGDWMPSYRFIVPLLPLIYFVIAQEWVIIGRKYTPLWPVAGLTFILGITALMGWKIWSVSETRYAPVMTIAEYTRGNERVGNLLARLVMPGDSIAVVDAGAIPYFSGVKTIDMPGLNDRHIAHLPGGFMLKYDNEYVLAQHPTFIQMHVIGYEGGLQPVDFIGTAQMYYSSEFHSRYEPIIESPYIFRRRTQPLPEMQVKNFYAARYLADVPSELAAGSVITLPVTFSNRGMLPWLASNLGAEWGRVFVISEWKDAEGRGVHGFARMPIPHNVLPDQTVLLNIPFSTPASVGTYLLLIDVEREKLYRLSDKGVPPFMAQVQVK